MYFSVPFTEADDETTAEDVVTGSEERGRKKRRERQTAVLRTDRGFSPFAGDRDLLPILKDHQSEHISLETILSLHKSILERHVGAGVLRTHDVSVGDDFDAMDWDEVPGEMDKYVRWLDAEMRAGVMSAAELAAHASHRFTIKELHKGILGRHVGAGVLRTHDVSVGDDFDPMDWDEVPAEMDKFVKWLDAKMKAGVMPAGELAARASHRFLFIHPFCDGNGRTSRLIINMIMERRGFEPLILPEETRNEFYDLLKEASSDKKDIVPYIKFISFHQQCCQ